MERRGDGAESFDAGSVSAGNSLAELDRAGWAWEWLRRNHQYQAEAAGTSAARSASAKETIELNPAAAALAARWGLHFRREPGCPGLVG